MAVARRPKNTSTPADIDALIERGGSVPSEPKSRGEGTAVPLRLPRSLLNRVDQAVAGEPVKTPRNTWILRAIVEKLDRDDVT